MYAPARPALTSSHCLGLCSGFQAIGCRYMVSLSSLLRGTDSYLDLKYLYREEPVVATKELEEVSLAEVAAGEEE